MEDEGSGLSCCPFRCHRQLGRTLVTLLSYYRLLPGREWLVIHHLPLHTSNYNSCYLEAVSQPFSVGDFVTEALPWWPRCGFPFPSTVHYLTVWSASQPASHCSYPSS